MKRIAIALILVVVISVSGLASEHLTKELDTVRLLVSEWAVVLKQVAAPPLFELDGSHAIAVHRLQKITNEVEKELIALVQRDMSEWTATFTLCLAYTYVGMQITTDAIRDRDIWKANTVAKLVVEWATMKVRELP